MFEMVALKLGLAAHIIFGRNFPKIWCPRLGDYLLQRTKFSELKKLPGQQGLQIIHKETKDYDANYDKAWRNAIMDTAYERSALEDLVYSAADFLVSCSAATAIVRVPYCQVFFLQFMVGFKGIIRKAVVSLAQSVAFEASSFFFAAQHFRYVKRTLSMRFHTIAIEVLWCWELLCPEILPYPLRHPLVQYLPGRSQGYSPLLQAALPSLHSIR